MTARVLLGGPELEETSVVHQLLNEHSPGVMLDVGAHHGSSLRPFAEGGWSVHAFEPDPANRAVLESRAALYARVSVVPKAVSDEPGQLVLYSSPESTGISSLAAFHESHRPVGNVPVVTLRDYLAEAHVDSVDFLKIDVEGFERNVLQGYPWEQGQPRVVVAEFEDAKTRSLGYTWTDLADFLVAQGYEVVVSEWHPIESYGTAHQWRRFSLYPAVLADTDAWGNLIAVRPADLPRVQQLEDRAARGYRRRRRAEPIVRPLRRLAMRLVKN